MEFLPECAIITSCGQRFGASCIASILACMAFYCVMHALVCPARFPAFCGCFYGLVRPVLAGRAMEFCGLFAVPGFLYSGRNCRARYAVKIGLYGVLWPYVCKYTFRGVSARSMPVFVGVWRAIESGALSDFARFLFCLYSCRSR